MVEFYLLTFSRFPLRKPENTNSSFHKNRTHNSGTTGRCSTVRGLLTIIDHSGDEYHYTLLKEKSERIYTFRSSTLGGKNSSRTYVRNINSSIRYYCPIKSSITLRSVVAYAPTEEAPEVQKTKCMAALNCTVSSVPAREYVFVLTDATTRTGKRGEGGGEADSKSKC